MLVKLTCTPENMYKSPKRSGAMNDNKCLQFTGDSLRNGGHAQWQSKCHGIKRILCKNQTSEIRKQRGCGCRIVSGYGCVVATQCAVRAVLQPHIHIRTRSCSRNLAAAAGQISYCRSLSNHENHIFLYLNPWSGSWELEMEMGDGNGMGGWVVGRIIAA